MTYRLIRQCQFRIIGPGTNAGDGIASELPYDARYI
jgi:hypothetical protein